MFLKKSSSVDKGTLYQLKNAINRTSVPMSPADNMKAAEDFILVVLHAHILAAAAEICESGVESVFELSAMIIDSYVQVKAQQLWSHVMVCFFMLATFYLLHSFGIASMMQ